MCAKLNVLTLLAFSNVYKKWTKKFYTTVMGDELTSCLVERCKTTLTRYLPARNSTVYKPMGDKMTRRICPIGVQKVDECGQNVLQKLR